MSNPCRKCIVQPMCQVSCEDFRGYLYSYDWIHDEAWKVTKKAPIGLIDIANYMKDKPKKYNVTYAVLFDLKQKVIDDNIIPREK